MAIKGLPKIEPNRRHGFTCSDDECWAHGHTRDVAFQNWREAKKETALMKIRTATLQEAIAAGQPRPAGRVWRDGSIQTASW